ncbi:kinase-like protein [Hymenopellis radicata]|nr:kinase-like protein [Hymenopellis radicata]
MSTQFSEWLAFADGLDLNTELSIHDGIASAEAAITEVFNITPSVLPVLLLGGNHPFRPPPSVIDSSLHVDRRWVGGLGLGKDIPLETESSTVLRKGLYRLALIACRRGYWMSPSHDDNDTAPAFAEDLSDSAQWTVLHTLGSGGFGMVRALRNTVTGQYIAEKRMFLPPQWSDYRKETRVMQSLNNVHIVKYLGEFYNERQSLFAIYMEYVPGGTLAGLAKLINLDDRDVRILSRQVLNGMVFLHSRQIVHRDIKGMNIFLTLEGCVKIGDLGTAEVDSTSDSFGGTPQWMSPEVVQSRSHDSRIDVWSFGMVIVEMKSQEHPWRHLQRFQMLFRLSNWTYDAPLYIQYTDELLAGAAPECHTVLRDIFKCEGDRPYSSQLLDMAWFSDMKM